MRLTARFRRSFRLTFLQSTTSTLQDGRREGRGGQMIQLSLPRSLRDFSQSVSRSVGRWQRESGLLQLPHFGTGNVPFWMIAECDNCALSSGEEPISNAFRCVKTNTFPKPKFLLINSQVGGRRVRSLSFHPFISTHC